MEFKKSLKKYRTENKLTQDELGNKLGLSGKVISKWESGYTIPDIERIKSLCEIFNCEYEDLVGPVGKTKTKKKEVKKEDNEVSKELELNISENDSKVLKCVSGLMYFLAKIIRVALYIGIVFIVLCMVILPSIVNMVDVSNKEISFRNFKDDVYYITKNDTSNKYVLRYNDKIIESDMDNYLFDKVTNIFNDYSKIEIIMRFESALVIALFSVTVLILVFYNLELLLNNIHDNNTPFTKENINHLGMIFCLLIAVYFCEFIISSILERFGIVSVSGFKIMEMAFLLMIVYIFKYGYNLQNTVKSKIYYEKKD